MTSDPPDAAPAALPPRGPGRPPPAGSRPLQTGRDARQLAGVRAALAAAEADPGGEAMRAANHWMLGQALGAASVELGTFDRTVLAELAGLAPGTCGALGSWITRAAQTSTALGTGGGAVIGKADLRTLRNALDDAIAWKDHTRRRDKIGDYYALTRALRGGQ